MDTLNKVLNEVIYPKEGKVYHRIVNDLFSEINRLAIDEPDRTDSDWYFIPFKIENILEIINPIHEDDVDVLNRMYKLLK